MLNFINKEFLANRLERVIIKRFDERVNFWKRATRFIIVDTAEYLKLCDILDSGCYETLSYNYGLLKRHQKEEFRELLSSLVGESVTNEILNS